MLSSDSSHDAGGSAGSEMLVVVGLHGAGLVLRTGITANIGRVNSNARGSSSLEVVVVAGLLGGLLMLLGVVSRGEARSNDHVIGRVEGLRVRVLDDGGSGVNTGRSARRKLVVVTRLLGGLVMVLAGMTMGGHGHDSGGSTRHENVVARLLSSVPGERLVGLHSGRVRGSVEVSSMLGRG